MTGPVEKVIKCLAAEDDMWNNNDMTHDHVMEDDNAGDDDAIMEAQSSWHHAHPRGRGDPQRRVPGLGHRTHTQRGLVSLPLSLVLRHLYEPASPPEYCPRS